jgi:hypothetical protein
MTPYALLHGKAEGLCKIVNHRYLIPGRELKPKLFKDNSNLSAKFLVSAAVTILISLNLDIYLKS